MAKHSSNGAPDFSAIETLVNQGKAVITAEDSAVVDLAMKLIEEGKTATFYLKDALFTEIIRRRNRAPEVAAAFNLQPMSAEEAARIETDFHIKLDGGSSRELCPRCGSVYGSYEFIKQGIEEHGEAVVRAVFSAKVSVLQINPTQNTRCQTCNLELTMYQVQQAPAVQGSLQSSGGGTHPIADASLPTEESGANHTYEYRSDNHGYGCCR